MDNDVQGMFLRAPKILFEDKNMSLKKHRLKILHIMPTDAQIYIHERERQRQDEKNLILFFFFE